MKIIQHPRFILACVLCLCMTGCASSGSQVSQNAGGSCEQQSHTSGSACATVQVRAGN